MNRKYTLLALLASLSTLNPQLSASPIGTAFTYQGRLNDGAQPANGTYDLTFAVYDDPTGPGIVAGPITNLMVEVANGLFTAPIDFGQNVFTGDARWLEIGVRSNGVAAEFTLLSPRHPLTPAPYAIHAEGVNASGISGTIAPANIGAGTITTVMLAAGAVGSNQLATGSVGAAQLAAGAVTASALADGAVTAAKVLTISNWYLALTITNPTPASPDRFGYSVAAVGNDRVLIGAYLDDTAAYNAGAAYLLNTNGTLLTTFTNSTQAYNSYFGYSVAGVGNDRVLIGAYYGYTGAFRAGAAYLFNTDGTLLTAFTNPTPALNDYFGYSVAAVGNDRVLIGACYDDTGAYNAGAAYLFSTNGTLLTTFTNPTPADEDYFGYSVAAVGNDRVLIGAPLDDTGADHAGAAYLFNTDGTPLTTFTNPTPASGDSFGCSVAAVGNDRVLIGAYYDDTGAGRAGAAYLFNTNGTLLTAFINPTPASSDYFGYSVAAVGNDRVLIGACYDDTGANNAGAAYLFSTNGTLLTTFTNPTPADGDYFGCSVAAVGNDRVLIGAYYDDTGADYAGAAYLFGMETYNPGLIAQGVHSGAVSTAALADGAVTATKIGGALLPTQIPELDASQIASGTVAMARLPGSLVTNGASGVNLTGTFSGNGAGVTNVNADLLDGQHGAFYQNAGNLIAGTLSLAVLPGTVLTNGATNATLSGTVTADRFISTTAEPPANVTPVLGMVWIRPGTFLMGSRDDEPDRHANEGPQTMVTLTRGFWMAAHEVTQAEFQAVMGTNTSQFTGDTNQPVERVNWVLATNYCGLLTQTEQTAGRIPADWAYRLPTEAEWEYGCRAGARTTRFGYGDDLSYAWYSANSGSTTHPVEQKLANPWGLMDMHGNVWEWCQDWYGTYPGGSVTDPQGPASGDGRVFRGGAWNTDPAWSRAGARSYDNPNNAGNILGFRVVLAPVVP